MKLLEKVTIKPGDLVSCHYPLGITYYSLRCLNIQHGWAFVQVVLLGGTILYGTFLEGDLSYAGPG